jgi:hypothetical protein
MEKCPLAAAGLGKPRIKSCAACQREHSSSPRKRAEISYRQVVKLVWEE